MQRPINLTLAILLAFSTISFAQQPAETPFQTPPSKPSSDSGQEAKKVQEPEYNYVIFNLDPAGALLPVERQKPNISTKLKYMGYGGAQSSTTYKGSRSPIRFKSGQDIQFVVRAPATGTEPDNLVTLTVLKVSKDERSIIGAKATLFGGAKSTNGESALPLKFSKYGEQSLKLSPADPLKPGEYVLTVGSGGFTVGSGFLFGIDPQ